MELFLLRHGRAAERGPDYPDDSLRPLTKDGRERMAHIARGMVHLPVRFERILTSPYPRAHQTAQLVARVFDAEDRLELLPELACGHGPEAIWRAVVREHADRVALLLVGHEPDLSQLGSYVLTCGLGLRLRMKKGGLCKLDVSHLAERPVAELAWLLTPRQLMTLGGAADR